MGTSHVLSHQHLLLPSYLQCPLTSTPVASLVPPMSSHINTCCFPRSSCGISPHINTCCFPPASHVPSHQHLLLPSFLACPLTSTPVADVRVLCDVWCAVCTWRARRGR